MKKNFKTTILGLMCACGGWMLTACSSDVDSALEIPEGKGVIKLSLNTNAGFDVSTKAVTEADYLNPDGYTVQLLKGGKIFNNFDYLYSDIPDFTEVGNGTYTLSAHKGDNPNLAIYTVDELYFYGDTTFTLKNDTVKADIKCKPNSARFNVAFDEKMATYFSDYSLNISTKAIKEIQKQDSYPWKKDTKGPLYFKVEEKEEVKVDIILTPKNATKGAKTINKKYTLSPADALKLIISPNVSSGKLNGIKIEFDDTTIEKPVDIEIPSDWV